MESVLEKRRRETDERLEALKKNLADTEKLLDKKACIYVTGSVGRGESSSHSDLDVFIVGLEKDERRLLSRLDEIIVKAQLIGASRDLKFPDFSGDGKYLEHYKVSQLCNEIGTSQDDAGNTFTSRLLLLLESRPLVGGDVYKDAITEVIAAYWRDYATHSSAFLPAFLTNDILRLWRTFCVNYEARTEKEPEGEMAKRKLLNYKLKHSRLLTCYSGLLYLAAVFVRSGTVRPEDAVAMTKLSPTQRLAWLAKESGGAVTTQATGLVELYENFLNETDHPKYELIETFKNTDAARKYMAKARVFGDRMFDLLQAVANGSPFFRFLVV
jgi:predicted nucleotidyltransferase